MATFVPAMSPQVIHIPNEKALDEAADKLLTACISRKIFAIYGAMGAGKTTFIKVICRHLGLDDNFSSPTYSIVNEYLGADRTRVFHIDLYRINTLAEAEEAGIEEYLNSGSYCFIEWPQVIEPILPSDAVALHLEVSEDGSRNLTIEN